MVRAGQFRDDLFYRLNATCISIAPLRERPEDIDILTYHFIALANRLLEKNIGSISREVMELIRAYQWPGNVRELSNVIESAIVFSSSNVLTKNELSADLLRSPQMQSAESRVAVDDSSDIEIRGALMRCLNESGGNRRRAAQILGVSRSTLYRLLSRYQPQ
jgi:transcriptional regulator with PAS, ATPase and Fis domain